MSAKPKTKSVAVVVVAVDDQLVDPVVCVFEVPQTSRTAPLVGIPEYSVTIACDHGWELLLIPVIPPGAFSK